MRLLARCSACKRQYDASGMKPADRFHCSCGTLVTVAAPTSAVLAVAHCGTCGAARTTQGKACAFCQSVFADGDLNRNTMCPACYGQIGDTARFCDHCGIPVQPTRLAGSATTLPCPVCTGATLRSRHLPEADHPIEECARCGGAWLEISLFDRVVDRARERTVSAAKARVQRALPTQDGPLYRPCPLCRQMMNRRNYGGNSAVIIDICKDHGIWFDADELGRLVTWVRGGGLDRQRERERSEADLKRRAQAVQAPARSLPPMDVLPDRREKNALLEVGIDLLGSVIGSIFRKL